MGDAGGVLTAPVSRRVRVRGSGAVHERRTGGVTAITAAVGIPRDAVAGTGAPTGHPWDRGIGPGRSGRVCRRPAGAGRVTRRAARGSRRLDVMRSRQVPCQPCGRSDIRVMHPLRGPEWVGTNLIRHLLVRGPTRGGRVGTPVDSSERVRHAEPLRFPGTAVSLFVCDVGYAGITAPWRVLYLPWMAPVPVGGLTGTIPGGHRAEHRPPTGPRSLNRKGRLGRRRGTQVFLVAAAASG